MSGFGVAFADAILAILAFSVFALLKSYIDEYYTAIQICAGIFVIIVGAFIFFKNPVPQIRKNRSGRTNLWQDFVSMFGFTLANFVVIIPYILAFFAMFNVELSTAQRVENVDNQQAVVETTQSPTHSTTPSTGEELAYEDEDGAEVGASPESESEAAPSVATTQQETKTPQNVERGMNSLFYNALIILGFLLGAMAWWLALTSIINLFRKGFRPRHMLTINHIAGVVIGILGIYTLLAVLIKL
jgi:threonine/homoserine/homoserine lactone efflux protein